MLFQGSRSAVGDPFEILFTALLGDPSHYKKIVILRADTDCVIIVYTALCSYKSKSMLMLSEWLWEGRFSPREALRPCLALTGSLERCSICWGQEGSYNCSHKLKLRIFNQGTCVQFCHLTSVWLTANSFISLVNFTHLNMDMHVVVLFSPPSSDRL